MSYKRDCRPAIHNTPFQGGRVGNIKDTTNQSYVSYFERKGIRDSKPATIRMEILKLLSEKEDIPEADVIDQFMKKMDLKYAKIREKLGKIPDDDILSEEQRLKRESIRNIYAQISRIHNRTAGKATNRYGER